VLGRVKLSARINGDPDRVPDACRVPLGR
jgi:hypothetical protein